MSRLSRTVLAPALVALLAIVTGCSAATPEPETSIGQILPDTMVGPLVSALPARTVTELPTTRLGDAMIPPTNRWFSGLVFGDTSMPVFPLPLGFQMTANGFTFGVPRVVSNEKVIASGFRAAVSADVGGDDYTVSAYDEASVTISTTADGTEIGTTVIAEGSPFVSFTASQSASVTLAEPMTAEGGAWTLSVDGTQYGLVTDGTVSTSGAEITLAPRQVATWFAVSTGGSLADFVSAASSPIVSTSIHYSVGEKLTTTSISYLKGDGSPTIVAAMPHQVAGLDDRTTCTAGSWASVYGELEACAVSDLDWSVPTLKSNGSLDLSGISAAESDRLVEQLSIDVASTRPEPADTYFGGKWMYRLANMLEIARQVGADDLASDIKKRLVTALDGWTDPDGCVDGTERCFVYDEQARGIVGLAASFGSDQFNDHHFHYGYFLYAAGVVAADDPALVSKWAPVMNLLAADIATQGDNTYFPQRRVFDAYAGHSWASGTSPFADGNNQESSSEAVNAWNGLALWATASDQSELATEAQWMLSAEAHSALAYWTNFDRNEPVYQGYAHNVASINWGAKRDYATWFSPEPSAMLGILVLPMSPVAGYLGIDPERVRDNIAEAAPTGPDVLFGDYLLMYSALAGSTNAATALDESASLNEDRIDDGNSRSYLLAWIISRL